MTDIILIIIGVIFMIGSFLITEKLSQKEIEQISKLSSVEMKRILEKNIETAEKVVEERVDDVIDHSMEIADRALEKETNMKIQEISEYAETVVESIHKSHEEVLFLYSMLNDKHTELTASAGKINKLKAELQSLDEQVTITVAESTDIVKKLIQQVKTAQVPEKTVETNEKTIPLQEKPELLNKNQSILELHKQGMNVVDIAKRLGLGVGEVKLVIDLYREGEA